MQRYFVSNKEDNIFTLNNDDSHHVINVMRMKTDDRIEVVFDSNLFIAAIISLDIPVRCKIVEEISNEALSIPNVIIAQALVKEQKMD